MSRTTLILIAFVLATGCGDSGNPVGPSPTPVLAVPRPGGPPTPVVVPPPPPPPPIDVRPVHSRFIDRFWQQFVFDHRHRLRGPPTTETIHAPSHAPTSGPTHDRIQGPQTEPPDSPTRLLLVPRQTGQETHSDTRTPGDPTYPRTEPRPALAVTGLDFLRGTAITCPPSARLHTGRSNPTRGRAHPQSVATQEHDPSSLLRQRRRR